MLLLYYSILKMISIVCFYIYIYCRKVNAEFNKLIKYRRLLYSVFVFRKMMLNKPTFANNFDFIWIFLYSHLSSP